MNAFDVLREKLTEAGKIKMSTHGGRCNGKTLALGYVKGIENAIEIVNQVEQEYKDSLPEPIPPERAEYAHEAAYIRGWNECLEKIAPVQ